MATRRSRDSNPKDSTLGMMSEADKHKDAPPQTPDYVTDEARYVKVCHKQLNTKHSLVHWENVRAARERYPNSDTRHRAHPMIHIRTRRRGGEMAVSLSAMNGGTRGVCAGLPSSAARSAFATASMLSSSFSTLRSMFASSAEVAVVVGDPCGLREHR